MLKRVLVALLALVCLAAGVYLSYRHWWIHRYDEVIERVSAVYGLDAELVHAVIYEESFFRDSAASHAGARGLMQVTGVVVEEWRRERAYERLPSEVRRRAEAPGATESDPEVNLHIGCWYLSKMLARFGDEADPLVVALAAYNAGATHAERWLRTSGHSKTREERVRAFIEAIDYPETRAYVVDVRKRYRESVEKKGARARRTTLSARQARAARAA